jgi:hypothetical protein
MAYLQMSVELKVAALRAGFALILISPVAFILLARFSALQAGPTNAANLWLNSRRAARAMRLIVVALWWMAWDLHNRSFFGSPSELLLFLIPPMVSVAISQSIAYSSSRDILRLKWRFSDIARLAFWSTVSPTAALLGVATGAEAIYEDGGRGRSCSLFLVSSLLQEGYVCAPRRGSGFVRSGSAGFTAELFSYPRKCQSRLKMCTSCPPEKGT